MSKYADPDPCGGILEPTGMIDVKFCAQYPNKVIQCLDQHLQL